MLVCTVYAAENGMKLQDNYVIRFNFDLVLQILWADTQVFIEFQWDMRNVKWFDGIRKFCN
jgi:hypothetical protein